MPKKSANVSLKSFDDIFSTEESRQEDKLEHIRQIPISELHAFEGHPFRVVDDEEMQKVVDSVAKFGVLTPLIARPDPDGGYEIISGHRRMHASELAGIETVPVIVREMDDDEAIICMVDSNLQRENILPSERAWAYRMKMDALKHQGISRDSTSTQVGWKLETAAIIGAATGESKNQVRRFIRLTELLPELLDMVDSKQIAFNPAVEISYLKPNEQKDFLEAMDAAQSAPSLSQAQRIKKLSQAKMCPEETKEALEKCGDDVVVMEIPDLGLEISVHGGHIVPSDGHHFLVGDTCGVVHSLDEEGEMAGLCAADIYAVQTYLKENTVLLVSDVPDYKCTAIQID